ncbi:MAG: MAPEG family protein [Parvibaculum sp.]|nr:MAPEG family protein [Parvibaculum sp.]
MQELTVACEEHPAMMSPQLKIWILAATWLTVKMFSISLLQARSRLSTGIFDQREDRRVFGHAAETAEDKERLSRLAGCWRNDLENIPIFLLLSLPLALISERPAFYGALMIVFAAARTVHSYANIKALQPQRNIAYQVGNMALAGVLVLLLELVLFT